MYSIASVGSFSNFARIPDAPQMTAAPGERRIVMIANFDW
jgi:hypothetical protein